MTGIGDGESGAALAEERLGRTGLEVKLDKGLGKTQQRYVKFRATGHLIPQEEAAYNGR